MNAIYKTLFGIIFLSAPCWTTSLIAQTSQPMTDPSVSAKDGPPQKPYYLTGKEEAWQNFPAKPALGSPVDQADLVITLTVQGSRTESQKDEALRDKSYSIKLMTEVIDPDFEHHHARLFQVLKNADIDSYFINSMLKNENGRLRPFVQHPTLVTPLFTTGDFSYPSGHATGMELQARILARVFPDKADALLLRARQVADSRVVAGVHYASDTEAGLGLGDLLFMELETTGKFQADLADAIAKDSVSTE